MKNKLLISLFFGILVMTGSAIAASIDFYPLNDGYYTDWLSWGLDTPGVMCSHFTCVDDFPVFDTVGGVQSNVDLAKETFTFRTTDPTVILGNINYVMVSYYVKEFSPLYTCMAPMLRLYNSSGGTDYFASPWCSLTSSFMIANQIWATNPATGQPWLPSELDPAYFEAGMRAEDFGRTTLAGANVSTVWLAVDYDFP